MDVRFIPSANPANPYSDAVAAGGLIFLSGLVSEDLQTGKPLPGDIAFETQTILHNAVALLEKLGSGKDKIVRVEIYLKDFADAEEMTRVYRQFFAGDRLPARICIAVKGFYEPAKIEMLITALN